MRVPPSLPLRPVSDAPSGERSGWLHTALLTALLCACGPVPLEATGQEDLGVVAQPVKQSNGLSTNGLSTNGLSTNGLTTNGLTTETFTLWFSEAPAAREQLMRYIAHCALGAGQVLEWTDPGTGRTYRWLGALGLAPDWSAGKAASKEEQQVITACLAAHANKYGMEVPISVLGLDSKRNEIPYTSEELATYSVEEACFFGNLFNGEGVFYGREGSLNNHESTLRACAFASTNTGPSSECPPLYFVGNCNTQCAKDKKKPYALFCAHKSIKYLAITTRLRPSEVYTCGDGVCQFPERCGTGNAWDNCSDCGPCQ